MGRLAGAIALSIVVAGCAAMNEQVSHRPEDVPADVRLPLRLTVVGQQGTMMLIYGGPEHDVFLGCLSCANDERESIFNPDGKWGSATADHSIWNPRGPYGSKVSDFSPWNPTGDCPPLLKDEYGHPHGYFTANAKYPGRTRDPATVRFLTLWTER